MIIDKEEKIFKNECMKWIDKLHLNDWDIGYLTNKGLPNGSAIFSYDGRKATICLAKEREKFISIESIAKHECLEILFADIRYFLERYYSKEFTDDEIHKLINKLMVAL